jgi:acyl-coenzyme A synthetase/AMP-(fatty) acid ligase
MCGNKNKFSLHGIKVISSGEYLSNDLRKKVSQDLDCKVYDTYGATEVWTTITFQDDPDTNDMGPILPGVESKIVEGELYIKHPLQAMMYWDDPVSTQKTFKQDWVATGDAVKIVDNRLSFLGRTDNMIKVKGTFVSLLDLEDTINSFPGVAECLVGINDTDAVPELVALVKFASEQRNVPHLRRYLRQLLPSDRIPKHIEVVTELPKTINNKLKRKVTSLIDYNK